MNRFYKILFNGYYYYVEVRNYKGINVVSESADLRLINPQLKKYQENLGSKTAFEMVFHPNGNYVLDGMRMNKS